MGSLGFEDLVYGNYVLRLCFFFKIPAFPCMMSLIIWSLEFCARILNEEFEMEEAVF